MTEEHKVLSNLFNHTAIKSLHILSCLKILENNTPAMPKLIVLTGGSKGIGKAILEKFASQGFHIVTCSRNESELNDLKKEFGTKYPRTETFTFRADMADKNQAKSFTTFAAGLQRSIDVLVNNAGHFLPGEITTEPEG